jgi:hypothetical protein
MAAPRVDKSKGANALRLPSKKVAGGISDTLQRNSACKTAPRITTAHSPSLMALLLQYLGRHLPHFCGSDLKVIEGGGRA